MQEQRQRQVQYAEAETKVQAGTTAKQQQQGGGQYNNNKRAKTRQGVAGTDLGSSRILKHGRTVELD